MTSRTGQDASLDNRIPMHYMTRGQRIKARPIYKPNIKHDPFRLRMYRTAERSQKPSKCSYCFRFLSNNCFMNGLFGLSHLIGYTQFMVFIIVRVIVLGSVAGRLFLHDEENLNCTVTNVTAMIQIHGDMFQENQSNDSRTLRFGADRGQLRNESIAEIKSTCIRAVYSGYMSPLCAWLISMFPTILAWLMIVCFYDKKTYVDCHNSNGKTYVYISWGILKWYIHDQMAFSTFK
ncbi:uncharacterized protein LOC100176175 [Ciona intestinalis]